MLGRSFALMCIVPSAAQSPAPTPPALSPVLTLSSPPCDVCNGACALCEGNCESLRTGRCAACWAVNPTVGACLDDSGDDCRVCWKPPPSPSPPTHEYEVSIPGLGRLRGGSGLSGYSGVAEFAGIPYAKAPVGKLRWQPPQSFGSWDGTRDATAFGASCMQSGGSGHSEDCLFLNLAAPISALNSSTQLPVMFWIHGGDYVAGSSSDFAIDALVAASNSSVLVASTNYRLNVFGFLGSNELQQRTTDGSTGNFGIQDQRMAMTWVRDNIGAFGGNGADMTIFGESAGGNSVWNHLANHASFSLYKKAVIESGTYYSGGVALSSAQSGYNSFLGSTGCKSLDCLLSLNATTVAGHSTGAHGPVIDGVELTDSPQEIVAQGKHNKDAVVMIGSNRDEKASPWWDYDSKSLTEAQFDSKYRRELGADGLTEVKQLYGSSAYPYPADLGGYSQWWWMAERIETDRVLGLGPCGARSVARALLKGGSQAVYAYLFAMPSQSSHTGIPGVGPDSVIVPHAAEIAFVFGRIKMLDGLENEKELALAMAAYWSSFAATGDPNHAGLPQWPRYSADTDELLRFDDAPSLGGVKVQHALRKEACDFWDARSEMNESAFLVVV